jgi:hypothetical protein
MQAEIYDDVFIICMIWMAVIRGGKGGSWHMLGNYQQVTLLDSLCKELSHH